MMMTLSKEGRIELVLLIGREGGLMYSKLYIHLVYNGFDDSQVFLFRKKQITQYIKQKPHDDRCTVVFIN